MSLMDHVTALLGPFLAHRATPSDVEERRLRQEQQARESALVLRQLRAELHLMRRWKHDTGRGGERP
jgi:hypothetical protein